MKNIVERWTIAKATVVDTLRTQRTALYESVKDIGSKCGQTPRAFTLKLGFSGNNAEYMLRFLPDKNGVGSVAVVRALYDTVVVDSNDQTCSSWAIHIELVEWLAARLPTITGRDIREACERTL